MFENKSSPGEVSTIGPWRLKRAFVFILRERAIMKYFLPFRSRFSALVDGNLFGRVQIWKGSRRLELKVPTPLL